MQTKGSWWQWVVGVLVLIVLAVLLWWLPLRQIRQNSSAPVFAPTGSVTQGFPPSLLIDSTAKITQSYSIAASGAKQYTAVWNSSATPFGVAAAYRTYFAVNQWQIVNEASSSPDLQGIYAVNASASVNMVAAASNDGSGGSSVTISYLQQP